MINWLVEPSPRPSCPYPVPITTVQDVFLVQTFKLIGERIISAVPSGYECGGVRELRNDVYQEIHLCKEYWLPMVSEWCIASLSTLMLSPLQTEVKIAETIAHWRIYYKVATHSE